MTYYLIIALPVAVHISGMILGAPRKTTPERYLFWMSCVGLVLFISGYIIGLIGDHIHVRPISEICSLALATGILLAVIGIGFQIGIGSARVMRMIRKKESK